MPNMIDLPDLRRELAAPLSTTPAALEARLKTVVPLMRAEARPEDSFRVYQAPPATSQNAGFLALTAMLGGPPKTAGERVGRMWRAAYETPGQKCRITGAAFLGECLTRLIDWDETRDFLEFAEYAVEYEVMTFVWRRGLGVSVFHPHDPERWQTTILHARTAGGLTHTAQLPAATFGKIADLLAANR